MNRATSGTALALGAALAYGTVLPASRALFDLGSNALSVGLLRYLALVVCLSIWIYFRQSARAKLSTRQWWASAAVGVCFALISIGQLLAMERISVSLTTLLFYSYPAMTTVGVAFATRRLPGIHRVMALLGASIGLALVLRVGGSVADTTGIALALLAAAAASAAFLLIEYQLSEADTPSATATSALVASIVTALALFMISEPAMPSTAGAMALLLGVMVLFATAVICTIVAVARAGSVRAALALFLEPIIAVALSVMVLGEQLSPGQWLGGAMVVIAVAMSATRDEPEVR